MKALPIVVAALEAMAELAELSKAEYGRQVDSRKYGRQVDSWKQLLHVIVVCYYCKHYSSVHEDCEDGHTLISKEIRDSIAMGQV